MRIKAGAWHGQVSPVQDYTEHLADGLVGTDGVQWSLVATVGTTAVEVLNKLIESPFDMHLKEFEVNLVQRFVGLNGSYVGSLVYYWQVRSEYVNSRGTKVTGDWINFTGTYQQAVGTLATLNGTYAGYIPVGSVPAAPVRLRLMAAGIQAAIATGEIKNDSYVRLVGVTIPGA